MLKFQKNTGDGACASNAIAGHLYDWIMVGADAKKQAIDSKRETEYAELLQCFQDFHPNFKPATLDNLKTWLTIYCQSMRDVELLISPVLLHWYNVKVQNIPRAESLAVLPHTYSEFTNSDYIAWLCEKLGFNLRLGGPFGIQQFYDTDLTPGFKPGPFVTVLGNDRNTHFDSILSKATVEKFAGKKSLLMAHHQENLFSAYSSTANPLQDPSSDALPLAVDVQTDRILYNRLRILQREVQRKQYDIESLTKDFVDPTSAKFDFDYVEDFKNMPDRATMLLMREMLECQNRTATEELHQRLTGKLRSNQEYKQTIKF